VQAQIMSLLEKLQNDRNTAIVLITHDLGVVASYANRINVMYAGKIVETGTADEIFYQPRHAYTFGLLSSLPRMDVKRQERLVPIKGIPPSLAKVPPGCPFHPRCNFASDQCLPEVPELRSVNGSAGGNGHRAACVHSDRVAMAHEEKVQ
jgi:peptide/nickel transport system ATP-binding protein